MFEKIIFESKKTQEEKREKEILLQNQEIDEILENEEEEKLRQSFALELKKPHQKSFFKKLQKIAAAFVLAGSLAFPLKEAVAPETTEEIVAAENLDYYEKNKPDIYQKVLKQIREKGGVTPSPQSKDTIYKTSKIGALTREMAFASEKPYYNNPEVILGEKFIKENPQKSKEYLQKINVAIKATVMLKIDDQKFASGSIIQGKEYKIVLTNAHVVKNRRFIDGRLANGEYTTFEIVAKDSKNDIAALKIPEIQVNNKILDNIEPLKICGVFPVNIFPSHNSDSVLDYKNNEQIATIGHPLGEFPFAVFMAKIDAYHSGQMTKTDSGAEFRPLEFKPDERFRYLELYTNDMPANNPAMPDLQIKEVAGKRTMPGVSGGPVIRLEKSEGPMLIGINSFGRFDLDGNYMRGGAVPANEILNFLKTNNLID